MKPLLLTAVSALIATAASPGATLIFDSFDNIATGATINGTTPETSLAGGDWNASTFMFRGNGNQGLTVTYPADTNRGAGINLGAGYLSSNPGVYQLSMDINHPAGFESSSSWFGIGFFANYASTNNMVANNGSPWMLYRLNGNISVYGGAGTGNARVTNITPAVHGAELGVTHRLSLVLDTSGVSWVMRAYVDNYEFDLNGTADGLAYTFTTAPTASSWVGFTNGLSGSSTATSAIDNFQLTFTAVPEPGSALLGLAGGALLLRRRRAVMA